MTEPQPTPQSAQSLMADLSQHNAPRPMTRMEIHFLFWLWTSFTLGSCYLLYAFQVAIKEANDPGTYPAYLWIYVAAILILFVGISLIDAMPDSPRKKLRPILFYKFHFGVTVVLLLLAYVLLADLNIKPYLPTSWPTALHPRWSILLENIATSPLSIMLLGVLVLYAHARKYRSRLREETKQRMAVDG